MTGWCRIKSSVFMASIWDNSEWPSQLLNSPQDQLRLQLQPPCELASSFAQFYFPTFLLVYLLRALHKNTCMQLSISVCFQGNQFLPQELCPRTRPVPKWVSGIILVKKWNDRIWMEAVRSSSKTKKETRQRLAMQKTANYGHRIRSSHQRAQYYRSTAQLLLQSRILSNFAFDLADTRITVCTWGEYCWPNTFFSFTYAMDISVLSCSNTLSPSPRCHYTSMYFQKSGLPKTADFHHRLLFVPNGF